MRTYFALALLLLVSVPAFAAAQDPCATAPAAPDTIYTGRSPTITLKMDKTQPSTIDPTITVPNNFDGFTVRVNGVSLPDFSTTSVPVPAVTCADGRWGYTIKLPSGYQKGSYTAGISAYLFQRDATGAPTSTKLESGVVTRPFVVVDPPAQAPSNPLNIRVW